MITWKEVLTFSVFILLVILMLYTVARVAFTYICASAQIKLHCTKYLYECIKIFL